MICGKPVVVVLWTGMLSYAGDMRTYGLKGRKYGWGYIADARSIADQSEGNEKFQGRTLHGLVDHGMHPFRTCDASALFLMVVDRDRLVKTDKEEFHFRSAQRGA